VKKTALKRAPRFGEDTENVLCSLLGMSRRDLLELENQKVISTLPTFPAGRPTRTGLIEKQRAGSFDPNYLSELKKHFQTRIGPKTDG
jgi:hypothetical protein